MSLEISQMTENDLKCISSCFSSEFDNFWNVSTLENELSNPNSIYLVLKEDNIILGFGGIWFGFEEVHITNIVIRKSKRKQGFGFKLLSELLTLAKQKENIYSVTLEVRESNIPAIRIISKIKF